MNQHIQHTTQQIVESRGLPVEFVSVKEATRVFGLSRSYIYELIKQGVIRSISLRNRGQSMGRRLIVYESLKSYMLSFSEGSDGGATDRTASAS